MTELHVMTQHRTGSPFPTLPRAHIERAMIYEALVGFVGQMPAWASQSFLSKGQEIPNWLQRAYDLGPNGHHQDLAFETMTAVNDLFYAGRFAEMDRILEAIDTTKVPLILLVSLVRFCSSAQARLPHLGAFRARSVREIVQRGRESETLLR